MSWRDLFERAEAYGVDEAAVLEALTERRQAEVGGDETEHDP